MTIKGEIAMSKEITIEKGVLYAKEDTGLQRKFIQVKFEGILLATNIVPVSGEYPEGARETLYLLNCGRYVLHREVYRTWSGHSVVSEVSKPMSLTELWVEGDLKPDESTLEKAGLVLVEILDEIPATEDETPNKAQEGEEPIKQVEEFEGEETLEEEGVELTI